jgi:hypothetical protein
MDIRIRSNFARPLLALLLAAFVMAVTLVVGGVRTAQALGCVVNDNGDAPAVNAATSCLTAGGTTTLRSAIQRTNNAGGTDTIFFNLPNPTTITLTNGVIPITNTPAQTLTITGAATPSAIVIDGNNNSGSFNIATGATVNISGVTIQHGKAGNGGAIDNSGTLTITNSVLTNNATTANGAGIENRSGILTLVDTAVTNNTITASGSGFVGAGIRSYNESGPATVNLTRVTISGNNITGTNAGGGGIDLENAGTYNFTNVTISGNSATATGGGIFLTNGAQLHATNITVANNTANAGGGFDVDPNSIAFVTNTIASGNTPDNCHGSGGLTSSLGHSLELGSSCAFTQASDIHADPLLGALATNPPGTLQTHSLPANSPAVDKADTAACPATDERGVQRKLDGTCDIGAFEFIAAAVTPTPTPGLPRAGAPVGPAGPALEVGFALVLAGAGLLVMIWMRRRPAR